MSKQELPRGARWVEVRDLLNDTWKKRILIFEQECNYLCVGKVYIDDFLNNKEYETIIWKNMREIKETRFIPWETQDLTKFTAIRLKGLDKRYWVSICEVREHAVTLSNGLIVDYRELFNRYLQFDGSPCGKEI